MKVGGPSGPSAPSSGSSRPSAAGGFSPLAPGGQTAATAAAAPTGAVSTVEALMALQQEDGPLERRRRAVSRASAMLDMMDEVKLALMDGEPTGASLERLARAVRQERSQTDDPKLEGLLDEIETRAAVELAKLETAKARH